ncbi:MAG: 3'(2'),5'-bisphosphate nucleotidase CysQ [Rikenellaceae bacterium]
MNKEKLKIAIKAALVAGDEILKIYNDPNSDFQVEIKNDNSPLTIADKKANLKIVEQLKQFSAPIISEEIATSNYATRKWWNDVWIVDPLDGTKEFIKKNGDFTVNIAYVSDGAPIIGVVYVPVTDTIYFAEKSLGSFKIEGVKNNTYYNLNDYLKQSTRLPYAKSRAFTVVASRSHMSEETAEFLSSIQKKHNNVELVSRGSSIKMCLVAEGTADIYPRFAPTMEWDTAAGDAIVRYAGKMTYLVDMKTPLVYNKENLLNPFFIVK